MPNISDQIPDMNNKNNISKSDCICWMLNTIWFRFDLIRIRKKIVCVYQQPISTENAYLCLILATKFFTGIIGTIGLFGKLIRPQCAISALFAFIKLTWQFLIRIGDLFRELQIFVYNVFFYCNRESQFQNSFREPISEHYRLWGV